MLIVLQYHTSVCGPIIFIIVVEYPYFSSTQNRPLIQGLPSLIDTFWPEQLDAIVESPTSLLKLRFPHNIPASNPRRHRKKTDTLSGASGCHGDCADLHLALGAAGDGREKKKEKKNNAGRLRAAWGWNARRPFPFGLSHMQ